MKRQLAMVVAFLALGVPAAADEKAELDKFKGTWAAVAVTEDGKPVAKEQVESMKLIVTGDGYTLKIGDQEIEGTHKLDPAKKPKELEAVRSKGPKKGEKMLGIYELTDDTFKVCFAAAGKDERPKAFKSEAGSGNRLMVFKREKK